MDGLCLFLEEKQQQLQQNNKKEKQKKQQQQKTNKQTKKTELLFLLTWYWYEEKVWLLWTLKINCEPLTDPDRWSTTIIHTLSVIFNYYTPVF